MHISLDSALGRQRRLNSVGESVLQIAPNAAAAYSLRSLTGADPKVVRVRRASDNGERDFTSSEITSGEMVNWVNRQVIAPLDIQALEADGRTGDFLIAKAAYSLRSLGTRQATLVADGDTVARANGKYVVQVRRSSDDALKSFTATEITDGTLLSFVGTGGSDNGFVYVWYDQSVTNQAGDTATGNHAVQATAASQPKIVNAGALVADNGIDFDGTTSSRFLVAPSVTGLESPFSVFSTSVRDAGSGYTVSLSRSAAANRYFAVQEAGTTSLAVPRNSTSGVSASDSVSGTDRLTFALTTGATSTSVGAFGSAVTTTTDDYGDDFTSSSGIDQIAIGLLRTAFPTGYFNGRIREILVYTSDQTDNRGAIEANIGEAYSITGIPAYDNTVDGFVETWYDQSGNNRPLIQPTASEQPLIVEAGVFQNGVKSNKATSNDTMQNLRLSTDGITENFGTDDWASGASSKLGAVYVGTVPEDSVVTNTNTAIIWGGSRGIGSFQEGGVALAVIKGGTDSWSIRNERQGLSPSSNANATSLNTDADVVLYGTTDNRELTINVNGSGDTETESVDLDVRENTALSLFGAYDKNGGRYYQRSSGGVCKECYLYAGDPVANIPALATSINAHYSIY